jgi:hypothetical protein
MPWHHFLRARNFPPVLFEQKISNGAAADISWLKFKLFVCDLKKNLHAIFKQKQL